MGENLDLFHDAQDAHVLYFMYDEGDGGIYRVDLDRNTTAEEINTVPHDAVKVATLTRKF